MKAPSKNLNREFQVGVFIFFGLLIIAAFSFRITQTPIFQQGTDFSTYLSDATGLFELSKVKMAGIDIGIITKIELENRKARISLKIYPGVEIPPNAKIVPRPLGILGDKYLEVVIPPTEPSKPTSESSSEGKSSLLFEGNPGAAIEWIVSQVVPGAYAQNRIAAPKNSKVIESVDSPVTLDDLTKQLSKVAEDMKVISETLRKLVEGGDPKSPIGRTIRNAEEASDELNKLLKTNSKDVTGLIESMGRVSRKLERVLDSVDRGQLGDDINNLAHSAENLGRSLKGIESITNKIDKGQGSLGRLINDPTTAAELNKALVTMNTALDRAERTKIYIEAMPEYAPHSQETKTYVGLRLAPRENSTYIGQLIIDSQGVKKTKTVTQIVNGTPTVTKTIEEDQSSYKFSVQFMKRIFDVAFRFGVFENTGGLGVDLFLFRDRFHLAAELYDFSKEYHSKPNLRTYAEFKIASIFMGRAIVENLLASPTYSVGLGISFSDEDLKTILLLPGVP
jgi:phospholipid/cholesterol/gamma-HCH transport system substrate-binding protein